MKTSYKLTSDQREEIAKKYQTGKYKVVDLAREYHVANQSICSLLKRRNIFIFNDKSQLRRIYPLDETYFNNIDSEDKAYFLGLLYADGCNHSKRGSIVLALAEEDVEILNQLRKFLKTEKPLSYRDNQKKHPTWKNIWVLQVSSKKLSNDLTRLGCIENKSLVLKFPTFDQVPINLIRHFIRGYYDGDGGISLVRHKTGYTSVNCHIMSTDSFCKNLIEITNNEINIIGGLCDPNKGNGMKYVLYNSYIKAVPFLNWIYTDSTIYLKRKYDIYIELLKLDQNRHERTRLQRLKRKRNSNGQFI